MTPLTPSQRITRFVIAIPVGIALYVGIQWAFFGKPTADKLDAMIGATIVFALLIAYPDFIRAITARLTGSRS